MDFNYKAYPHFYEEKGILFIFYQFNLVNSGRKFILSSYSLQAELKIYYPNYTNNVKILRFACSLPGINGVDIDSIKQNHGIEFPYFMSPN